MSNPKKHAKSLLFAVILTIFFGCTAGMASLVDSQTPRQVLVPTDDSLELGWTFPGFPIGPEWTTGTSGIGFDVTVVAGLI